MRLSSKIPSTRKGTSVYQHSGRVAQPVEHRTFNPVAAGSNPAPFTILKSSKPLQSLAETLIFAGVFFCSVVGALVGIMTFSDWKWHSETVAGGNARGNTRNGF